MNDIASRRARNISLRFPQEKYRGTACLDILTISKNRKSWKGDTKSVLQTESREIEGEMNGIPMNSVS